MNVACPGCGTRYAILDEKVRGRRVRMMCKHCSAPILVDGTSLSDSSQSSLTPPATGKPTAPKQPTPKERAEITPNAAVRGEPATAAQKADASAQVPPASPPKAASAAKLPSPQLTKKDSGKQLASPRVPAVQPQAAANARKGGEPRAIPAIAQPEARTPAGPKPREPERAAHPSSVVTPAATPLAQAPAPTEDTAVAAPPVLAAGAPPEAALANEAAPEFQSRTPMSPMLARRGPPRALRGTIIGVAEPANAPITKSHPPLAAPALASSPVATSRVPVTAGPGPALTVDPSLRQQTEAVSPDVATRGAAAVALTPSEDRPSPMAVPSAKVVRKPSNRALHRTIIGVAAPAGASDIDLPPAERGSVRVPSLRLVPERDGLKPADAVAPEREGVKPAVAVPPRTARAGVADLKRTIIGGLEAPRKVEAPNQAVGLGVPVEPKWTVIVPKQGPSEMSGPEIVRAFALGKLTADANVWREGMSGWQPLAEVASLKPLFQRAGLTLEPPQALTIPDAVSDEEGFAAPEAHAARASFSQERPTVPRSPTLRPATPLPAPELTSTDSSESTGRAREHFDGKEVEEITRIAPSPWQVTDVGAKVAARMAVNAGLPPRQNSAPPMRKDDANQEPLDRLSKRPDIGPRDTVRGQVAAGSSPPLTTPPSSAPPTAREPIARQKDSTTIATAQLEAGAPAGLGSLGPGGASEQPSLPSAELNTMPWQPEAATAVMEGSVAPRAEGKRKRLVSRWWFWVALAAVVAAALVASYRTKHPRVAYAYLHRHGWDVPLDRTARGMHNATENYVKRPYRAVVQRLRGKAKR